MAEGVGVLEHVYNSVGVDEHCLIGNDTLEVALDMPVCVQEGTELWVKFDVTGNVVLKVRNELGFLNKNVQSVLNVAREQVVSMIPEDVQISNFCAPSQAAYFGHPDREFHAKMNLN